MRYCLNPDDAGDGYAGVVDYNGRKYVIYGTQSGTIKPDMIEKCVGYLDGDTGARLYTLCGTGDYLAEYDVGGVMEQFTFLRALDTADEDIYTPDYIGSLGYDIWNQNS